MDLETSPASGLATLGPMGSVKPRREQQRDIDFAWPLLAEIAAMEIGHALAVRERDVIAVEAAEGIEAVIDRAGSLCRRKGWTLLVTASEAHPAAVDVATLRRLARAGARCLALGVRRVRVVGKADVIRAADRARIAIVGIGEG